MLDICLKVIIAKIFDGIKKPNNVASSDGLNIDAIKPTGFNGLPVPLKTGASIIWLPFLINLYGESPFFLCSCLNVSSIISIDFIQSLSNIELSLVNR